MRVLWTLIKNNFFVSVVKKPISFAIMTILPIIVLVASSAMITYSSTGISVGISDNDSSYMSKVIDNILSNVDGIAIKRVPSNEVQSNFRDNTINIGVVMDKGFDEALKNGKIEGITIYANEGSNDYMLITSILKNHMLNFRNLGRVTGGDTDKFHEAIAKYVANTSVVSKQSLNDLYADYNNSNLFIGFLIMLIFFKASSVANIINIDKENNIYSRIFGAKVKAWQYYGANVVCNILIAMFQLLIAVFAMQYLVDISVGIRPFDLFIILSVISAVAVAFGTMCVAITKDVDSASMLSNLCILLFVLIGGSFIEVQYFPPAINTMSYISPARWALSCVMALREGASFGDISWRIGIMALMAAAFLFVAFYVTDKRDKSFMSLRS
jgi:ABC-2 type transport system permease protein